MFALLLQDTGVPVTLLDSGAQLPVDCVLLLGGVTGAAAGLRRMPRSRWRPAIGGHPHRRPPRRRVSPAPFFLANCGGFGWVGFLSDVIGGVESALWEGCYPALTLAHGRGLRGGGRRGWCEEWARSG
jgi:hypothetical protein